MRGVSDGRRIVYSITDAGRAELAARADDLVGIEHRLADSVRLIAEGVRGSVREAMRSLKADLAAATQPARPHDSPESPPHARPEDNLRVQSRVQLQRADAALNDFRVSMRTELRGHVARGGELPATAVDQLIATLAEARRALGDALGR